MVLEQFIEIVKEMPNAVALVDQLGQMTYEELLLQSKRIANRLKSSGLKKGDVITITLPKNNNYIATILGSWMLGIVFAALGNAYPKDRIDYIASDCKSKLIVDEEYLEDIEKEKPLEKYEKISLEEPSLLVYTSGSTGKPKGVLHTHHSIIAGYERGLCVYKALGLKEPKGKRLAETAPLSFVAGITLVTSALCSGETIYLVPNETIRDPNLLSEYFYKNKIDIAFIPPKLLKVFDNKDKHLQIVMTGSEKVTNTYRDDFTLVNCYGSSESTGGILYFVVDKEYENTPVGKSFGKEKVYILDENNKEVEEGEICLTGHFAIEYLNLKEQTEKTFVKNPFKAKDGFDMMLRTGDIGRKLKDGNILYLNRKDWMIKINGQRVEPGEIEQTIRQIPEVFDVAIKDFVSPTGQTHICAYYVLKEGAKLDEEKAKEFLLSKLPAYMVPSYFKNLSKLPVNANGKLDRNALPAPDFGSASNQFVAPRNELEKKLVKGFEKTLNINKVSVLDDFFLLGGDSIRVMALQQLLPNIGLTTRLIYENKTVEKIAEALKNQKAKKVEKADLTKAYPLTQAQLGIFLESIKNEGKAAYNNPILLAFPKKTDINKLKEAIEKTVKAHPGLFASILIENDNPSMKYNPEFAKQEIVSVEEMDEKAFELEKADLEQPFYLLKDRLFRFRIIKTEKCPYLFLDIHHIIFDGFSMRILFDDLFDAYEGKKIEVEKFTAFDASIKEINERKSEMYPLAKKWYLDNFKNVKKVSLPQGDLNEKETRFGVANIELDIGSEDLLIYCKEKKTTENVVTTSAFGLLLGAYNFENKVAFATVYNGRHDLDSERTISMFVRTLPILCDINQNDSVSTYLSNMKERMMGAMTNDCFSFAELCAESGYTSDVLFTWQGGIFVVPSFKDGVIKQVSLPFNATGEKLCLQIYPANGKLQLNVQYHANLYSEDFINALAKNYEKTLKNLLSKEKIEKVSLIKERRKEQAQLRKAKDYYKRLLDGRDFDFNLVNDINLKEGETKSLDILYELNLDSFVKKNKLSVDALWLSAFGLTLARFLNRKDSFFTTMDDNNNLIPMVLEPFKDDNTLSFIKESESQLEQSISNNIYSFKELVRDFDIRGDIVFVYDKKIKKFKEQPSILIKVNKEKIRVEYDGKKFESWSIVSLIDSLLLAIKALSKEEKPSLISLLKEPTDKFNKTEADVKENTLISLFDESVKKHPNNTAVIFNDEKLTYKQVDELTNKIASYLAGKGIGRGKVVSVMVTRSINMVICPLAVMKTGAAYQPLDCTYPTERLEFMIKDAGSSLLIADKELLEKVPNNSLPVLLTEDFAKLEKANKELKGPLPIDPMILLYTSGTTGVPKGVILTQFNLVNFSYWYHRYYDLTPTSVVAAYAGFGFDACMMDLYPALTMGAAVCVVPEDLRMNLDQLKEYFGKNKVSHAFMTTQVGRMFAEQNDTCYSLKHLSVGGEKLAPLSKLPSGYKFYNGYGPTECTIFSTIQPYDKQYERIPIGQPLDNYKLYVVDLDAKEVPVGCLGELWISGFGVGNGYLNQLEKTKATFIDNPFSKEEGYKKVYRTGDIVRRLEDGRIDFIGRNDGQVKIRGFRIELTEVEMIIREYPNIKDVTVQAFKDETSGGMFLAAYLTSKTKIDIADLKKFILKQKPPYMVPASIMQIDEIPLNQNQKVNKKALPKPIFTEEGNEYVEASTPLEKEIADLYKEILGSDKVGATDSFFDIGGSSLTAAKVVMHALSKGYSIAYKDVFDNPSPRELAKLIESRQGNNQSTKQEEGDVQNIEHPSLAFNDIKYVDEINGDKDLGTVLLTGSTGFLGIHILKELINNKVKTIALVRGKGVDSLSRLKGMLAYYFDSPLDEEVKKYVTVIDGDITDASLIETCKKYEFDTIINAAACVKHFANDDIIERINVTGVKTLIEIAKQKGVRLVQISTLSVAGDNIDHKFDSNYLMKENQLFFGQDLSNKYINSKFKAEEAILEAIEKDKLDAKIIRVGNLMSRQSDGEFQINSITNAFMRTLKGYKYLGKFPVSMLDNKTDFSPIDETAKTVLLLAKTPQKFTVFHSMNSHLVQMGDVIDAMNLAGIKIEKVSDLEFKKSIQEVLSDEKRSVHVSSLFSYATNDSHSHELIQSDNAFTIKVLYRLGYRWPITDFEYLLKAIKSLEQLDFFDREDI